jgi:hypothetical protein
MPGGDIHSGDPHSGNTHSGDRRCFVPIAPILGLAIAGAAALLASARLDAQTAPPGLPPVGTYAYTIRPDSSDDVKAAISRTVDPMSFLTRGIARGRLTKANPVPQRVTVRVGTDTVAIRFDDGNACTTPFDGDSVPYLSSITKERYMAHLVVAGDSVIESINAGDGIRRNAYVFLDSATRLRLVVTISSPKLPGPLRYSLLFARATPDTTH